MPALLVNKETELALRGVREIDRRTNGELVRTAREKAKTFDAKNVGAHLATAMQIVFTPVVQLAPPPTVKMLNMFMNKVDWTYVAEMLVINPELN